MTIAIIELAIFPNKNHHYPRLKIDIYIIKNAFFGDLLHTGQGDFL
jgi:hypothetical protein